MSEEQIRKADQLQTQSVSLMKEAGELLTAGEQELTASLRSKDASFLKQTAKLNQTGLMFRITTLRQMLARLRDLDDEISVLNGMWQTGTEALEERKNSLTLSSIQLKQVMTQVETKLRILQELCEATEAMKEAAADSEAIQKAQELNAFAKKLQEFGP